MGLIEPRKANPPTGVYGHCEALVAERARAAGVDPRFYQEVAWAGAKGCQDQGLDIVNQAIERTRITGMPRDEIVRRGLARSEIPIYGIGGLAAAILRRGNRCRLSEVAPTKFAPSEIFGI